MFESSSYDFSRNDSFYDALPIAAGNSYDYGGNSRRYENTVARDGCSARVEKSLSWGRETFARKCKHMLPQWKKRRNVEQISKKLPSYRAKEEVETDREFCIVQLAHRFYILAEDANSLIILYVYTILSIPDFTLKEVGFEKLSNWSRTLYIEVATKCNKINERTNFPSFTSSFKVT